MVSRKDSNIVLSDVENSLISLFLNSVTDTLNFKSLGITLGNAFDHICDQCPCQAVQGLVFFVLWPGCSHRFHLEGHHDRPRRKKS